jgi:hypothetical protein
MYDRNTPSMLFDMEQPVLPLQIRTQSLANPISCLFGFLPEKGGRAD